MHYTMHAASTYIPNLETAYKFFNWLKNYKYFGEWTWTVLTYAIHVIDNSFKNKIGIMVWRKGVRIMSSETIFDMSKGDLHTALCSLWEMAAALLIMEVSSR